MVTKRTLRAAVVIKSDINNLEDLIHNHPNQDYAATHARLTSSFSNLRLSVLDSTIRDNHPIHQELVQLQSRIESLSSKEKEPTPSSSYPTSTHSKSKSIQLPKLHLTTFSGDLMDWAPFWSLFKTAVDSNAELSQEHKLAYLRDAIKDSSIRSLLFSGAEREGLYSEVVELLHKRYDKRRTIHSAYCHQHSPQSKTQGQIFSNSWTRSSMQSLD